MATQTNLIQQMLSQLPQLTDTEFGEGVLFADGALVWVDAAEACGESKGGICDVCDDGEGAVWLSQIQPETTEAAVWDALYVAGEIRGVLEILLASGHVSHAQVEMALEQSRNGKTDQDGTIPGSHATTQIDGVSGVSTVLELEDPAKPGPRWEQLIFMSILVGENQKPGPSPGVAEWARGRDPWHPDAFKGTAAEGYFVKTEERRGGWAGYDWCGNQIAWVADGERV